jgi:muramoyltetrapeptide carboxypeptidase
MILQPPSLKRGDTIGIVSTARKIAPEELEPSVRLLEDEGFKVVFGDNLFAADNQFAGTDKQRADDVMRFVRDSSVHAILCARGGYGSARILRYLSYDDIKSNPKWFCGYSDVTVMHALYQYLGMASLHSTMPINFPKDASANESTRSLVDTLLGSPSVANAAPNSLNIFGEAKGRLVGGNLSLIYSLIGTPLQVVPEGSILFIEDLDEYLYHMDRTMLSLRQCGLLSRFSGIAVGYLNDMNDNTVPFGKTAEEIVYEHTYDLGIPVAFGIPAGHLEPNYTLMLGKSYTLTCSEEGAKLQVEL